ncbi:pilus assembly protein TadG-related protein [Streptomyces sp. GC420]|uniref:pilus assembly protein TadG-related protein n=1 Tax=Streptomyces sp. GC420 TaxID=2697568 RepID=UPI001414EFAA|nr:pilus assembly protein TadG-related protein [Streptomyces sp. GC420]NBM17329.1 hypothetical protein [Streptomyces sp. GC420]
MPLYVWLVGTLLFVAFVFFVFAKAAVARSGAQAAADAAALAAAQEVRGELVDGLGGAIGNDDDWLNWLAGEGPGADGVAAATDLAAANDATLEGLTPGSVGGFPSFKASIVTNYTVGESLIPGTENTQAHASATAVIEPRCAPEPGIDPIETVAFECGSDGNFELDPEDFVLEDLPDASVLFSVYLAE